VGQKTSSWWPGLETHSKFFLSRAPSSAPSSRGCPCRNDPPDLSIQGEKDGKHFAVGQRADASTT